MCNSLRIVRPDFGSVQWIALIGFRLRTVDSTVRSRNPGPDDSKRMEIDSSLSDRVTVKAGHYRTCGLDYIWTEIWTEFWAVYN